MTKIFHELLLSELRMASYQPGNPDDMTDDLLCTAVTMNENLQSLGITLRTDDLLRLAVSPSLGEFYRTLSELIPDVKAQPMYPGFPQQVMEMSEAEFRLHQMIHYFSTYGLETLLGRQVKRGWLPEHDGPERTVRDTALMGCRVIELVPEQEVPVTVMSALLSRRERLTNPELELVAECASLCSPEQLQGIKIRFKENLDLVFSLMMGLSDRKAALRTLHAVCAHTGDVFRCAKEYLRMKRWHLTTSEKKLLVRLLESYTPADLRRNLIQSLRLRERNILVLQYLDYNRFTGSAEHRETVRALRNGELLSWFGTGEKLLKEHRPEALEYFAQRPGYMLRMISRLLALHYSAESIEKALLPAAGNISGHLVVKTIRALMKRKTEADRKYNAAAEECRQKYRMENAYLAEEYDTLCRRAWKKAYLEADTLQEDYDAMERELRRKKKILRRLMNEPKIPENTRVLINADVDLKDNLHLLFYRDQPEMLEDDLKTMEAEMASLAEKIEAARMIGDAVYEEYEARIREQDKGVFKAMQMLKERETVELDRLQREHEEKILTMQNDFQTAEILKKLLKRHFQQAETPLKGRKVFLDLDPFDLEHSTLETEDRSKDGGYIRSGISYRIPKGARYVRFFVYWNDHVRVDIDLHAGGRDTNGQPIHVGWNADFRDCGVVHSGDITHSDAAEYIDIDLSASVREIYANVNLFFGRRTFSQIETCYVGLMAVDQINQNVRHYDPANCFFTHALTQKTNNLFYGFINVQEGYVRFVGQPNQNGWGDWASRPEIEGEGDLFSLREYLDCVMEGQSAQYAQNPSEADVTLTMGKSPDKLAVSLADNSFFLEC